MIALKMANAILSAIFALMLSFDGNNEILCPSEHCKMCNGEACNKCGAGCWDNAAPLCEHDVIERHEDADISRHLHDAFS